MRGPLSATAVRPRLRWAIGMGIMINRALALATAAVLVSAALVAGQVLAQGAAAPAPSDFVIKGIDRDWIRRAGTEGPYTPDRACRMGVRQAVVVMDCTARPDGALVGCLIVDETPRDMGFGASVMIMAGRHVLTATPLPADAAAAGPRRVRLTIPISIPPGGCS
jgi:hypothetical protein